MSFKAKFVFVSVFLLFASVEAAYCKPAIFDAGPYAQAKAKAQKEGKLFVVDCTATWCGPCRAMDETTWQDSSVKQWFEKNAVAVQIDVDKDDRLAGELHVEAMPTIIVYVPGKKREFVREVGYKRAVELLTWLKAAAAGERPIDVLRKQASATFGKGGEAEIEARYQLANGMVDATNYEGAATQYQWLWSNIPTEAPAKMQLRNSEMVGEIRALIVRYAAAREAFAALRDAAEMTNRTDWILLNRALGDNAKTLQWYDSVKNDSSKSDEVKQAGPVLRTVLFTTKRYAEAAAFYPDPLAELRARSSENSDKDYARVALPVQMFICLLAAGREAEADDVLAESLKSDKTGQLRMLFFEEASLAPNPLLAKAKIIVEGRESGVCIAGGVLVALLGFCLISRFMSRSKETP